MSKQQDTWFEAALRGLDKELGGAIGPLSDQDMVTAKAMVIATLRKTITADPAGFRQSLDANAQAAAVMMGATEPAPAAGSESGAASPIRNLRKSLASGKAAGKAGSAGGAKKEAVPEF